MSTTIDPEVGEQDSNSEGSKALEGALLGGLVVGLGGALVASFIIWPSAGLHLGFSGFAIMALAGSVFGVVAGGVAGAAERKSAPVTTAARAERGRSLETVAPAERKEVGKPRESFAA